MSDISPGAACGRILQLEQGLGSSVLSDHGPAGVTRYAGTQGGREATVEYLCEIGKQAEQGDSVTFTSHDEALRFASEQKRELTRHLGEPLHDGLDLGLWQRLLLGFKGADLDYLTSVVVWGKGKDDALLQVRQTGDSLWEISVSRGISKMEYILNS